MFQNITFSVYGRSTEDSTWYITNPPGVNRFYYIHSGNVCYSSGQHTHMLKSGMLYFFPQNLPFKLLLDDSTRVDHTYFDFFTFPVLHRSDILEIDPSKHPLISSAAAILIMLAEAYPMNAFPRSDIHIELLKSYFANLFTLIHQEMPLAIITDADINSAIRFIHNNYNSEISVATLALQCNLETNFFIKKFKRYMGLPPHKYLMSYRMSIARQLLHNKENTIAQIAEHICYSDSAAFSHAFHKTYGCYPTEYQAFAPFSESLSRKSNSTNLSI